MKQPHQTCISLQALMRLFFLWIVTFANIPSFAQQLYFRNLSINDGLPSSLVYDAMEDESGYMWFATDKGISRYDGSRFLTLSPEDGFFSRGAFRIFKSTDGRLWFVTLDFRLYCYDRGKMSRINTNDDIAWITESEDKKIWALGRRGGIFCIDAKGILNTRKYLQSRQAGAIYYNICSLGSDRFLVSGSQGVLDVDLGNKNYDRKILDHNTISSGIVSRVFKGSNHNYFIANGEGLFQVSLNGNVLGNPIKKFDSKQCEIISYYEDSLSSDVWLGTTKGVFVLDKTKGFQFVQEYLKNTFCYNILKSKDGIVWVTTPENGVKYTNTNVSHFISEDGLKNLKVKFIKQSSDWIYGISSDGNTSVIKNNKVVHSWNLSESVDVPFFSDVSMIKDTVCVKAKPGEFVKIYKGVRSKMTFPYDWSVFFGYDDYYFVANNRILKGLKYQPVCTIKVASKLADSVAYNVTKHIPLLILGDTLFFYKTKDGYGYVNSRKLNALHLERIKSDVSSMYVTARGNMFVSTLDKGLYIAKKNGKKYFFNSEQGLISNFCSKLIFHKNEIWVATNKGVSRLTLNKEDSIVAIANYTTTDVFISPEINDLLCNDDYVYVATNSGITCFKHEYRPSKMAPNVIIEHVHVNDRDTVYGYDKTLELSYSQNNITIYYNSPSIRSNKNMFYRYQVTGKNVREISGESQSAILQLGSLAPDQYTIKIWARNIDGLWSQSPALLYVTILKPFWQRIWFMIIVLVVFFLIVYLIVVYRLKQIKERNRIKSQLLDSELKALRLHMNPHFIFNTLNSLQKFTLERNPLEANKYISMFAKLMRWIMSYSDKQNITLEEEFTFLDTYIALEQLRFDRFFNITKEIDSKISPRNTFIPALIIQPFVENAIKYGIAGLTVQGELYLKFEQHDDYLLITIQDNGVGRNKVKEDQFLSGKEYESTGIKYTNERLLLLLSDKLQFENAVTITDLYENGESSGTRVELIMPYYNE